MAKATPSKKRASPSVKRTNGGRFLPGNPGGPGNPFAKRAVQLRSILFSEITEPDFKALSRKLYDLAMGGDMAAMQMLFQYLLGKPKDLDDTGESGGGTKIVIEFTDAKMQEAKACDEPSGASATDKPCANA